jgi:hypothetical protein
MPRLLDLLLSFFLVGCTAQWTVNLEADLYNTCSYPVYITLHNHTSYTDYVNSDKPLDPGNARNVLWILCSHDDLPLCVSNDFKLEISSNGKILTLGRAEFFKVLGRSKEKKGNTLHHWTIKDLTLCP